MFVADRDVSRDEEALAETTALPLMAGGQPALLSESAVGERLAAFGFSDARRTRRRCCGADTGLLAGPPV